MHQHFTVAADSGLARALPPQAGPSPPGSDQRGTPRRRIRLARVLLAIGAVALALVAVEVGFRLYYLRVGGTAVRDFQPTQEAEWKARWLESHRGRDPNSFEGSDEYHREFGWKPRPNLHKAAFASRAPISTNSRGWRGVREFSFQKAAGVKRIVLLGDSFTFGEDEEDEHVWAEVLQEALRKWEVINLGVHGYGTDQELLVFREEGIRYQPDIVVLGFFAENVLRNGLSFRDYAKPRFALRDGRLALTNVPVPTPAEVLASDRPLRPISYAWEWASRRLRGTLGTGGAGTDDLSLRQLTLVLLREIRSVCERCGARLLVVIIPNPRRPDPRTEQIVVEAGPEIGYATLELGPLLQEVEKKEGRPTYYLHFSRLGHVVAARAVRDKLLELGWIGAADLGSRELLDQRYQMALHAKPLDPESRYSYALFLVKQGHIDEAIGHLRAALAAGASKQFDIHTNLGSLLRLKGELTEAADQYRQAVEIDPNSPVGPMNLGDLLMTLGKPEEAARWYRRALELEPTAALSCIRLAGALAHSGRSEEAIGYYEEAIRKAPTLVEAYVELSALLNHRDRAREAVGILQRGLARVPDHPAMVNNLAWVLATSSDDSVRDGEEAVRLVERLGRAEEISDLGVLDTMAAAYAEAGRFDRAVATATRAIELANRSGRSDAARDLEGRLRSYRGGYPYRERRAAPTASTKP
jgi:tetratricopeptide (TPR) repeat protein